MKHVGFKTNISLKDKNTKSIKIETWRSFKEEMQVLGITSQDIF